MVHGAPRMRAGRSGAERTGPGIGVYLTCQGFIRSDAEPGLVTVTKARESWGDRTRRLRLAVFAAHGVGAAVLLAATLGRFARLRLRCGNRRAAGGWRRASLMITLSTVMRPQSGPGMGLHPGPPS